MMSKFEEFLNGALQGTEACLIHWRNIPKPTDAELTQTHAAIEKIFFEKSDRQMHACYLKSLLLLRGWGIAQDTEQSIVYLKKAIESGNPCATVQLGMLYLKNAETRETGFQLLQEGAVQLIENKMFILGRMALFSQAKELMNYKNDYQTAIILFGKAAKLNHPTAAGILKATKKKADAFAKSLEKLELLESKQAEFLKKAALETDNDKKAIYSNKANAIEYISKRCRAVISAFICSDSHEKINQIEPLSKDIQYSKAVATIAAHSGLHQLLVDIIAGIFTLGASLIYRAVTGNRFFKVNTDSVNKLRDLQEDFQWNAMSVSMDI